jgi:hypothetical protein
MDIKLEYPQHADHIAHPGTLLICCQTLIHLQPQFCYECKCTVSIKRDMHIPTDWLALKHGMSHRNWTWKHVWAVDDLSQVSFCKDEASQIQIHCKLWEKTRLPEATPTQKAWTTGISFVQLFHVFHVFFCFLWKYKAVLQVLGIGLVCPALIANWMPIHYTQLACRS